MALGTTIKSIQDIMRKDAGVDGDAQRISQLVWMLFLKVFDDREAEKELLDDAYKSPIPQRLRWRAWAKDAEGITGDELLDFVNNDLFKTLKELPASGKSAALAGVVRGVFEDAFNYMKSGTLMRQVLNKLEEIDFNRQADRHEFGDLYEKLLGDLQTAGNAGEFYTPRAVTQFIVDQVDPKLGETVLDPACGTGGFLTCAIEHLRKRYVKSAKDEAKLQASVLGVEKKPLPHLLCVTNMMFHGIDVPSNIRHDNTLARPLRDYGPKDRVDVVVTKPPFGGMEEDGIEGNFPAQFRTRETADLFLVLLVTLLKPGGRAALVLPDGTLFGEGIKTRIKEMLLTECNLHTYRAAPEGRLRAVHGHQDQPPLLRQGRAHEGRVVLRAPVPRRREELLEDQAAAHRGVRAREEVVVQAHGDGPRVEGLARRDPRARLQPRREEPPGRRRGTRRPRRAPAGLRGRGGGGGGAAGPTARRARQGATGRGVSGGAFDVERFVRCFPVIAEAEGGIKRLRRLVYRLAVSGSLHRADASTELIPVAELGTIFGGGTPSKASAEYWSGPIPWVSPKDMKVSVVSDTEDHVSQSAIDNGRIKLVPQGSVVMVVRSGILRRMFPVSVTAVPCTLNQDMKGLTPRRGIDPFYLQVAFRGLERIVLSDFVKGGVTVESMVWDSFLQFKIPVPPPSEQKRIVSKVDELMRLIDELEAKQEQKRDVQARYRTAALGALTEAEGSDELAAVGEYVVGHFEAVFDTSSAHAVVWQTIQQLAIAGRLGTQELHDAPVGELFNGDGPQECDSEGVAEVPAGWLWMTAGSICAPGTVITYGVLKPVWVTKGVPTIRVKDIQNGRLVVSGVANCSEDRALLFQRTKLQAGDLLIAKDGATLGKTAFVPAALEGGNITQHVLRFAIDPRLDRQFVRLVIDSPHGQRWMKGETRGVALPGVNVEDIRRMPIPLPPLAEQAASSPRSTP